jgi:hypothetical protein
MNETNKIRDDFLSRLKAPPAKKTPLRLSEKDLILLSRACFWAAGFLDRLRRALDAGDRGALEVVAEEGVEEAAFRRALGDFENDLEALRERLEAEIDSEPGPMNPNADGPKMAAMWGALVYAAGLARELKFSPADFLGWAQSTWNSSLKDGDAPLGPADYEEAREALLEYLSDT